MKEEGERHGVEPDDGGREGERRGRSMATACIHKHTVTGGHVAPVLTVRYRAPQMRSPTASLLTSPPPQTVNGDG